MIKGVMAEPYGGVVFEGRQAMLLAGRVAISLQEHAASDGSHFDPTRTLTSRKRSN